MAYFQAYFFKQSWSHSPRFCMKLNRSSRNSFRFSSSSNSYNWNREKEIHQYFTHTFVSVFQWVINTWWLGMCILHLHLNFWEFDSCVVVFHQFSIKFMIPFKKNRFLSVLWFVGCQTNKQKVRYSFLTNNKISKEQGSGKIIDMILYLEVQEDVLHCTVPSFWHCWMMVKEKWRWCKAEETSQRLSLIFGNTQNVTYLVIRRPVPSSPPLFSIILGARALQLKAVDSCVPRHTDELFKVFSPPASDLPHAVTGWQQCFDSIYHLWWTG